MTSTAGLPQTDVILLYAQYLIHKGRFFAATTVMKPLLKKKSVDSRVALLYAQAAAHTDRYEDVYEMLDQVSGIGPKQLSNEMSGLRDPENRQPLAERYTQQLASVIRVGTQEVFSEGSIALADQQLHRLIEEEQVGWAGDVEAWSYFIGEYCVRNLGASWSWRHGLVESVVHLPSGNGLIEICPYVWATWRLAGPHNHLRNLIRVLLELTRATAERIQAITGAEGPFSPDAYRPDPTRDICTEALHCSIGLAGAGHAIRGLGVLSDNPISRMMVPVTVEAKDGLRAVLIWNEPGDMDAFHRYLDLLCLGPFARCPWTIVDPAGAPAKSARAYENSDPGVRASLVARRLCSEDPAANARWLVTIAEVLFETTLDGSPDSIADIDRIIDNHLSPGGQSRWGDLYSDRYAILFMLTCYCGEILRARYGGRWGSDRITGRPIGPTSGLELGNIRYNIGASILKRFHQDGRTALTPGAVEFAQRARSRGRG
jgi:hypothetical protein